MFELARDYLEKESIIKYIVEKGIISPVNEAYGEKNNLVKGSKRIEMAKLALKDSKVFNWIEVSDWESRKSEWSRTVDVLRYHKNVLEQQYPDPLTRPELKMLCGSDLLRSFGKAGLWTNEHITEIISHYGLVVITRLGSDPYSFIYETDILARNSKGIFVVREWIGNEISATRVRRAIRRGLSIKYIVADSVIDFIKLEGLYMS